MNTTQPERATSAPCLTPEGEPSEVPKPPPGSKRIFVVGDRVQWTHLSRRGPCVEFNSWAGKIVALEGEVAVIQRRKPYRVHVSRLRYENERSELTESLLALAQQIEERAAAS